MGKKELEQLRSLKQELGTLQRKYNKTKSMELVADTYGDYKTGCKKIKVMRGISSKSKKELFKMIEKKTAELEVQILELEKYLNKINDPQIRDIFRLYYAEGLSQQEIGKKKGYSRAAIGKKIERFFEKNKK